MRAWFLSALLSVVLSGCIGSPPGSDASVSDDLGGDATADGGDVTPGCSEDCDDGNPCTDDACVDQSCVNTPNTAPCDDADACTVDDVCAGGVCSGEAMECTQGASCIEGECSCVEKFRRCGELCIPEDTCCDSNDCDDGEECPEAGGSCECTAQMPRFCAEDGECHPAGTCCNADDCPNNQECLEGPGGACGCPAGEKLCDAACIPEADCCTKEDCGGLNEVCVEGACACPAGWSDCNGQCYPTCCPHARTSTSCQPCGRFVCNGAGTGYDCVPDSNSNCGPGYPPCSQTVDCSNQAGYSRCQARVTNMVTNPFECACSGCY